MPIICARLVIKYHFFETLSDNVPSNGSSQVKVFGGNSAAGNKSLDTPRAMSKVQALNWVKEVLDRTRGRELPGNFNALVVGELFWEQPSKWREFAERYLRRVMQLCTHFMKAVFEENCAKHMNDALWQAMIKGALKQRHEAAEKELASLAQDLKDYPINYNHYHTDTKSKRRLEREKSEISNCIKRAKLSPRAMPSQFGTPGLGGPELFDEAKVVESIAVRFDPNMDNHASEDAMDSLMSIYKVRPMRSQNILKTPSPLLIPTLQVCQKTFFANVTTQVIERHIVRGLQDVFSPMTVYRMSDAETLRIAAEPQSAQKQRQDLQEKVKKLRDGNEILQDLMGSAAY